MDAAQAGTAAEQIMSSYVNRWIEASRLDQKSPEQQKLAGAASNVSFEKLLRLGDSDDLQERSRFSSS
jgi:hypothetical protein